MTTLMIKTPRSQLDAEFSGCRVGKWTPIARAKARGNRVNCRWWCRCDCGTVKKVQARSLRNLQSMSCGCSISEPRPSRRGAKHGNWKGGRRVNSNGYVEIQVELPWDHCKTVKMAEHRYVMAVNLGRDLLPTERVHHLDGNRQNNSIDNLELWTIDHPAGTRVSDAVDYAKRILREYDPSSLATET